MQSVVASFAVLLQTVKAFRVLESTKKTDSNDDAKADGSPQWRFVETNESGWQPEPHCHWANYRPTCSPANEGKSYFANHADILGGDAESLSSCRGGWLYHGVKHVSMKFTCQSGDDPTTPAPTPAPQAVYVQGADSANKCPGSAWPIRTKDECVQAARSMTFGFKSDTIKGDYPKGCYSTFGGSVFWNKHATGAPRRWVRPLCKTKPAPYMKGPYGTLRCPVGMVQGVTPAQCEEAMRQFGLPLTHGEHTHYPEGCYVLDGWAGWWNWAQYNTSAYRDAAVVCRKRS